ncbi:MAG: alpha/beta hydrolase [Chlamydiae bacterium]|nr:alpha/beta hydrolase [Chlamydiota bacterium]
MGALSGFAEQKFLWIGPDLHLTAPTVIYFALSGYESLHTDPFNQVAMHLASQGVRVLSTDIPAHGENLPSIDALKGWANDISHGHDPLTPFFNNTARSLNVFKEKRVIDSEQVALVGLSRGAFIATQIAARLPWIKAILGFAPLTQLKLAKEFHFLAHNDLVQSLDLNLIIPELIHKKIRFYISNRDTRVGTKECFNFIYELAHKAFEANIRSPELELLIKPPIGHHGHGTSKEVFLEGASWLASLWKDL